MQIYHLNGERGGGATTLARAVVTGLEAEGFDAILVVAREQEASHQKAHHKVENVLSARELDSVLRYWEVPDISALVLDEYNSFPKSNDGDLLIRLKEMERSGRNVPRRVIVLNNI